MLVIFNFCKISVLIHFINEAEIIPLLLSHIASQSY
jgi:glycosyltransferase involved in cell wall biosynthesis